MTHSIHLSCETAYETADFPFAFEELAELVICRGLETEACPYDTAVEILLTDDEGIRSINRETRAIDEVTDVLSFPAVPFTAASDFASLAARPSALFSHENGALLLGDIVISLPRCKAQAAAYGHSTKREFAFLLTHSLLHLLGYDHMVASEETVMQTKQESILSSLQITRETKEE